MHDGDKAYSYPNCWLFSGVLSKSLARRGRGIKKGGKDGTHRFNFKQVYALLGGKSGCVQDKTLFFR